MNIAWSEELNDSWDLMLADKAGVFRRRLGTLYRIDDGGYAVVPRDATVADTLFLDSHLSVDDAQRAAKLLICVGEKHV